jgi:hypothetical protein
MIRAWYVAALILLIARVAPATDVYVLRFLAGGAMVSACSQITWSDEILFRNPGAQPATVELVETTYDLLPGIARSLELPPQRVTSLTATNVRWQAATFPFIGVAHLRVPDDVQVTSRVLPGVAQCTGACSCPPFTNGQGALPQRTYTELIPANSPNIHLGADLPGIGSRTNVQVYNASDFPADVTVEIHENCGDLTLASTRLSVQPRSIATAGLTPQLQTCPVSELSYDAGTYVLVRSNQPGLSWVTTLANDMAIPRVSMAAN